MAWRLPGGNSLDIDHITGVELTVRGDSCDSCPNFNPSPAYTLTHPMFPL